jgi:hypothetical protein
MMLQDNPTPGRTVSAMSSWGTAIFAEDTAVAVLDFYLSKLQDQVSDDQAAADTVAAFTFIGDDPAFWIALAAAQSQLGRLDANTKDRAVAFIDAGHGLDPFTGADRELRAQHLDKLRQQLTRRRQSTRRRIRPPAGHQTDLRAGAILSVMTKHRRVAVLRVIRVESTRAGKYPVVQLLSWSATYHPNTDDFRDLRPRTVQVADDDQLALDGAAGDVPPITLAVRTPPSGEPTWSHLRFRDCGSGGLRRADRDAPVDADVTWAQLRTRLDVEPPEA